MVMTSLVPRIENMSSFCSHWWKSLDAFDVLMFWCFEEIAEFHAYVRKYDWTSACSIIGHYVLFCLGSRWNFSHVCVRRTKQERIIETTYIAWKGFSWINPPLYYRLMSLLAKCMSMMNIETNELKKEDIVHTTSKLHLVPTTTFSPFLLFIFYDHALHFFVA